MRIHIDINIIDHNILTQFWASARSFTALPFTKVLLLFPHFSRWLWLCLKLIRLFRAICPALFSLFALLFRLTFSATSFICCLLSPSTAARFCCVGRKRGLAQSTCAAQWNPRTSSAPSSRVCWYDIFRVYTQPVLRVCMRVWRERLYTSSHKSA